MANILDPRTVGVNLRTREEKARWAALAPLDSMPSRYPIEGPINDMGIKAAWEGLVAAGHLNFLFDHPFGSYKALTLEFLSTLRVNYEDKVLTSITFRLLNNEHTLTLAEFNGIFHLMDEGEEGYTEEFPQDYDRDDFWGRITLNEASSSHGPTFTPSRAKINSIRNPVLRYMAKALVLYPFAHKEVGSISSEMLFILWGMLAQRRVNTGYFMIKHLERHSKKKNGKLCCGGVVTNLAFYFGVNVAERVPDLGSIKIDWSILRRSGMIVVDGRGVGYFILDTDTFFRFPSSQLTAVGGWTYQDNWKMNTPAHLERMASDPPQGRGHPSQNPMYVAPHYIPNPEIPVEPLRIQEGGAATENDDEEDDEEEATEYEEGESSRPKRRRPRGRPSRASQLAEIAAGVRSLQLGQESQREQLQQLREDSILWRTQQESRLDYYGNQIQHLQSQSDDMWAAQQAFYRAYYARFPPPSD